MATMSDTSALSNGAIADLLATTLPNLPPDGKFEILQKYNDYPVCNLMFQKDKVEFDGGVSIVRNVQLKENGSAAFIRPNDVLTPGIVDVQGRLRANWVQAKADYSIMREEILRNRSKAQIIKLQTSRRVAAYGDICNTLEERAWQAPTSSADDLHPMGIPYTLVPITGAQVTAGTFGHQGANPTGFSDCYGLDASASANERFRSYNDVWSNSAGDLADEDIKKATRMLRRLHFRGPTFVKDMEDGRFDNLRLYACEKIIDSAEDRARSNNDSLGSDIGKFAGATVIKNIPLVWVPQLDTDTSNPLYAVNHDYLMPFVMKDDWFRETEPMNDKTQPNTFTTYIFLQFNFLCTNRQRAGGLISYVAAG